MINTNISEKEYGTMIVENRKFRISVSDCRITEFFLKSDGSCLSDKNGEFLSACFTLHSDDVTKLKSESMSAYTERKSHYDKCEKMDSCICFEDTQNRIKTTCFLSDKGLVVKSRTDNEEISQFGLNLDMNFMSKKGGDFRKQLLPTSPYTSSDGKYMYCLMTRPDGSFVTVCAKTHCDGWKIKYSPFAYGHYIMNFQFLSSFDKIYPSSNSKEIEIEIRFADDLKSAFENIQDSFGMPVCMNVLSGGFDGYAVVRTLGEADYLEICDPDGTVQTEPVTDFIKLHKFGFYSVTPCKDGKRGLDCVVWNGGDLHELFDKSCDSIKEPYHCDRNICEGGAFLWAILLNMNLHSHTKYDILVRKELDTVTGKCEYVPRRTIVPHKTDEYEAYHICKSGRIQEQFFASSILLEAYKLYGEKEYLEFAVNALLELADNYMKDGMLVNGHGVDYTTVCCPAIAFCDVSNALKDIEDVRYKIFEEKTIEIAEHLLRRGFDFPTEGALSDLVDKEYEDGSISCTALSLLYICKNLHYDERYIDFACKVLDLHNAWVIYTPDARMYSSSFRWWETIWEGDGQGPAICAGHAWTVWRAEAQFLRGILTKDDKALLDSWNAFVTNFSKTQSDGTMYSCFEADYIRGGGDENEQKCLAQLCENDVGVKYEIAHSYPNHADNSLSRYAYVRCAQTWLYTAAILEIDGKTVAINMHEQDGEWCVDDRIKHVYIGKIKEGIKLSEKIIEKEFCL